MQEVRLLFIVFPRARGVLAQITNLPKPHAHYTTTSTLQRETGVNTPMLKMVTFVSFYDDDNGPAVNICSARPSLFPARVSTRPKGTTCPHQSFCLLTHPNSPPHLQSLPYMTGLTIMSPPTALIEHPSNTSQSIKTHDPTITPFLSKQVKLCPTPPKFQRHRNPYPTAHHSQIETSPPVFLPPQFPTSLIARRYAGAQFPFSYHPTNRQTPALQTFFPPSHSPHSASALLESLSTPSSLNHAQPDARPPYYAYSLQHKSSKAHSRPVPPQGCTYRHPAIYQPTNVQAPPSIALRLRASRASLQTPDPNTRHPVPKHNKTPTYLPECSHCQTQ